MAVAVSVLIHPGNDHRAPERCVGYGIPYADGVLIVICPSCRADEGQTCTRRGGGAHTTRIDKALRYYRGNAYRLFHKLENAALQKDPSGPLWSFQSLPHQCGVLGAHVLSDCRAGYPAGGGDERG